MPQNFNGPVTVDNQEILTAGANISTLNNDSGFVTSSYHDNTKQDTIDSSHKLAASNISGLATVATSGSYNDLSNKPAIPDISGKADKASVTAATKCKITYNAQGIVTGGANLSASDIPNLDTSKLTSGTFADARIASASTWNAKQNALPTTTTAGKVLTSTTTAGTVQWADAAGGAGDYDLVIRTQAEFTTLVNNLINGTLPSTVHSILFVGSGKTVPSTTTLPTPDFTHSGPGLEFPKTVRTLKGIGNPIIANTGLTGSDNIMEITMSYGQSYSYMTGLSYDTASIDGIWVMVTPAAENTVGFYGIMGPHVSNCIVTSEFNDSVNREIAMGIVGAWISNCNVNIIGDEVEICAGIYGEDFVDNCISVATSRGSGNTAIAFYTCSMISNCLGATYCYGGTSTIYYDCSYASNCRIGAVAGLLVAQSIWSGTTTKRDDNSCDLDS